MAPAARQPGSRPVRGEHQEGGDVTDGLSDQLLVGAGRRRGDRHVLHRSAPLSAAMTLPRCPAKPISTTLVAVALPHQLTHVHHAGAGHVGGPDIADVGVVLPHDGLGLGPVVVHQPIEGVGHVAVRDVPGLAVGADHAAVVALGAGDHLGVLAGIQGRLGVTVGDDRSLAELHQQAHHVILTGLGDQPGGPGIALRILAVGLEAVVGPAGRIERLGIVLAQVLEHDAQRVPQRVHVQAVEADVVAVFLVVLAQPLGRRQPPPRWPHIHVGNARRSPAPHERCGGARLGPSPTG